MNTTRIVKGALLGMALLCGWSTIAMAAGPGAVRKQIESSMLVSGEISIDSAGRVSSVILDEPGKLPGGIVNFVHGQLNGWAFEPVLVDGQAVPARSRMSLRVVAKRHGEDGISVGIRSANFLGTEANEGESVSSVRMLPPRYPQAAAQAGAQGTVYLVLKVDRRGLVEEAVAEQVNLRVIGSERQMELWREMFARASLHAARNWTFAPPTAGDSVDEPYWSVRVPVEFTWNRSEKSPSEQYGQWYAYVPGPLQRAPWTEEEDDPIMPDALADGGVHTAASQQLRLLTELDGR